MPHSRVKHDRRLARQHRGSAGSTAAAAAASSMEQHGDADGCRPNTKCDAYHAVCKMVALYFVGIGSVAGAAPARAAC